MAEGGAEKKRGEDSATFPEQEEWTEPMQGTGHCKWFNVRMGFGFISMTSRGGNTVDPPLDAFVHQSKLFMEGFRSLREGEPVEFTFKKSSKGLECLWVTGPGGSPCAGSERRAKGRPMMQRQKTKGDRCYNCGGLDHHAKECSLPPQPKKCHYCQSTTHMVAHCPHRAGLPAATQGRFIFDPHPSPPGHSPEAGPRASSTAASTQGCSPHSKSSSSPEDTVSKGFSVQRRKRSR